MSDKRATVLHAAGHSTLTSPDGIVERDTLQCCHCMQHWEVKPGSGKLRGWCGRCNGYTCGPDCSVAKPGECVPKEKWLDCYEKGVDPLTVTTVCGGWSPSPAGSILVPNA